MALRDGLWSIGVLEFVAVFLLLALNYRVSEAVNSEGLVLQAFKLRLEDPLGALSNWNDSDVTPCKWKGVVCNNVSQVVTFIVASGGEPIAPLGVDYPFPPQLEYSYPPDGNILTNIVNTLIWSSGCMECMPCSRPNSQLVRLFGHTSSDRYLSEQNPWIS